MRRVVAPLAVVVALAAPALATPHALPFTYPSESLTKGASELEQYVDLTTTHVYNTQGATAWTLKSIITTEFEYGITNKLELGLYLQLANDISAQQGVTTPPLTFDGVKQRLRYRLGAPGQYPVDLSFYLEVAELVDEVELEWKVNLQRRVGPLTFMTNLWFEHEWYYNGGDEWVLHPTAGATVQLHPVFHLGLEFWMHAEYGQQIKDPLTAFNAAPHYYGGPTALLMLGRFWCSAGAYLRFDGVTDKTPVGALYGHVWVRTMLGVDL